MDTQDLGILITNICINASEESIREYFGNFGTVKYVKIIPDKFNEGANICYMKFSNEESAKTAVQEGDKSDQLGSCIRVSLKKIVFKDRNADSNNDRPNTNRNGDYQDRSNNRPNGHFGMNGNRIENGDNFEKPSTPKKYGGFLGKPEETNHISRQLSGTGRGRGAIKNGMKPMNNVQPDVVLDCIELPLKTKIIAEVIELKNLNSILLRPINLTSSSKQEIELLLQKYNSNTKQLDDVDCPKVGNNYLVRWKEDNLYYRAKILNKISETEYTVSFVDEGNSGDIVTDIKHLPQDLIAFPCQFVECSMDCEESPDFINFIVQQTSDAEISIFTCTKANAEGMYNINLYIGDTDAILLFNKQSSVDVRKYPFANELDIINHKPGTEYNNFQFINHPLNAKDIFKIVILDSINLKPKLTNLKALPITNDLVIFKQSTDFFHRASVQSSKISGNDITFKIRLIDENRCVEATIDQLANADSLVITPPRVINCSMDEIPSKFSEDSIKIVSYDSKSDVYSIKYVQKVIEGDLIGREFESAISHIESANEIYVQCMSDSETILNLEESLSNFKSSLLSTQCLKVGMMVVAPFENMLYRAIIIKIHDDMARVNFVDYGNSDNVKISEIMKITNEISGIKRLALKCKLQMTISSDENDKAIELINNFCESTENIVNVKLLTQNNGVYEIDLLIPGKSSLKEFLKENGIEDYQTDVKPNNSARQVTMDLDERVRELERRIMKLEQYVK